MFTAEPQTATLKVKGKAKVKGSDFKLPPQVELVNKTSPIATLTKNDAELQMEVKIEQGIGYEPVERRKIKKVEIGVIPIDAIFTPVQRVDYRVEHMRVGERTDFDRLKIGIETDGTITPEDAFLKACEILIEHFSLFLKSFSSSKANKEEKEKKTLEEKKDAKKSSKKAKS